jgi:hypothetical protein
MDLMLKTFLLGQLSTMESQIVALKQMIVMVSGDQAPQRVNSSSKPQIVDDEIDKRMNTIFDDCKSAIDDNLGG